MKPKRSNRNAAGALPDYRARPSKKDHYAGGLASHRTACGAMPPGIENLRESAHREAEACTAGWLGLRGRREDRETCESDKSADTPTGFLSRVTAIRPGKRPARPNKVSARVLTA